VIIECDLHEGDSPERIAQAALAGLGSVDILINNAGGSRRFTLDAARSSGRGASRSTSRASASSRTSCCRR
jgi:NAD(P)-dependent dehydrogenase (short-subunit alcohol dehydrogenase family)